MIHPMSERQSRLLLLLTAAMFVLLLLSWHDPVLTRVLEMISLQLRNPLSSSSSFPRQRSPVFKFGSETLQGIPDVFSANGVHSLSYI